MVIHQSEKKSFLTLEGLRDEVEETTSSIIGILNKLEVDMISANTMGVSDFSVCLNIFLLCIVYIIHDIDVVFFTCMKISTIKVSWEYERSGSITKFSTKTNAILEMEYTNGATDVCFEEDEKQWRVDFKHRTATVKDWNDTVNVYRRSLGNS